MIGTYDNIDRTDAAYNTKAPFTYESTMDVDGSVLPSGCVLGIRVRCVPGRRPPFHIGSISHPDGDEPICRLTFVDTTGAEACHLDMLGGNDSLAWTTSFLLDPEGLLAGHITYSPEFPQFFYTFPDTRLAENAFILLPQCHQAWLTSGIRAFSIDGKQVQDDITIRPDSYVYSQTQGQDTAFWAIDTTGPYVENAGANGICQLTCNNVLSVNGEPLSEAMSPVWLGGKHLAIRSSIASNLRVSVQDGTLSLKGVQDGQ